MIVEGLNDFIIDLENTANIMPQRLEVLVNRVSGKLLRNVKLKTPVSTGQLRQAWKVTKVGQLEAIVSNSTEYAMFVEFPHRTRSGSVVEGRYMLKRSVDEIEEALEEEFNAILNGAF